MHDPEPNVADLESRLATRRETARSPGRWSQLRFRSCTFGRVRRRLSGRRVAGDGWSCALPNGGSQTLQARGRRFETCRAHHPDQQRNKPRDRAGAVAWTICGCTPSSMSIETTVWRKAVHIDHVELVRLRRQENAYVRSTSTRSRFGQLRRATNDRQSQAGSADRTHLKRLLLGRVDGAAGLSGGGPGPCLPRCPSRALGFGQYRVPRWLPRAGWQ
jgi:hypothetical protein